MFCGKCGTQNVDNATFCVGCGEKLSAGETSTPISAGTNTDDKNRKVGMIAVAAIAVIVVAFLVFIFGGRSAEDTAKKLAECTMGGSAKEIVELWPEKVLDKLLEEEGITYKEFVRQGNESLQDVYEELDEYLGKGWKISSKVTGSEKITGNDLEYLKEDYKRTFGIKVSEAKEIELTVSIKGKETEMENTLTVPVIKVGRSWYIDVANMDELW